MLPTMGGGQTLVRDSDAGLVDRLRSGDEPTFAWLIDTYSAPLLRLAVTFVQDAAACALRFDQTPVR